MKMEKPLILITNDDSIAAPGINALMEIMTELGDVYVVAPDKPQSGQSHAITIQYPLRFTEFHSDLNVKAFSCNGTPVDCVKLALDKIVPRRPSLIVSGINHGSNSSINILYSGTMAAAIEGTAAYIPSIGFSLLDYSMNADFSHCKKFVKTIAQNTLKNGLPSLTALNVNIPAVIAGEIKGIKVCRQAKATWVENFEERQDPHHRFYYWLKGIFKNDDIADDTDEWALKHNYVSVVPITIDYTNHNAIQTINNWNLNA